MAVDLLGAANDFLDAYGLVAVFVLLVLDGAMLLPVLPGEVIMVVAVTKYARSMSSLLLLIGVATAAALVGSMLLYGVARLGGRRLVDAHPRLFMMDRRRREKLERSFQRPVGQSLVMLLRLIPFTRVLVNIPAGVARMPFKRFLILSTIGLLVFHAGFMWLTYEYHRPESQVAQQAATLQAAYAEPSWEYVQANRVVTALAVLMIGAVLSFRSSTRMLRDPEGASGSLLGWLAARVLWWGGIALGVAVWLQPQTLFELAATGGLDIPSVAAMIDYEPVTLVAYAATAASCIGLVLIALEGGARRRRRRADKLRKLAAMPVGGKAPDGTPRPTSAGAAAVPQRPETGHANAWVDRPRHGGR